MCIWGYSLYSNKYEGFLRRFGILSIFLRFWIKKYMCESIEALLFVFVDSDLGIESQEKLGMNCNAVFVIWDCCG